MAALGTTRAPRAGARQAHGQAWGAAQRRGAGWGAKTTSSRLLWGLHKDAEVERFYEDLQDL